MWCPLRRSWRLLTARWLNPWRRQLQDTDPITPRQLEKELRLKWAQRLVSLLAPFVDKIPNMASIMSPHQEREWLDLLGDTRFRTLRIHCLALETLQTTGFTQIPWTESDVREHLNRMRVEEASPHKIQRVWETLRWFSKRFGFLRIDACERLMEKKKTLQEQGVDTVAKPQRKAILPTKEVIWTLEEVAAGSGQTPAGSGENMSAHTILDQYICGVVRFQVACNARFKVFVPDCAYQLGFPRDQHQYLGNWTTETTADIYTRDKRNVVEKVWKAVGGQDGYPLAGQPHCAASD